MKLLILTSNAIRHKYLANTLSQSADHSLVVSECRPGDDSSGGQEQKPNSPSTLEQHFLLRQETEKSYFAEHDVFRGEAILPILYKETNSQYTFGVIKNFNPDLAIVFGSSIIKEPLLSLLPPGRFLNLHLGLSPYYRGSGTNLWPFVNGELEYVGSTILYLDAGVDTGDILCHVRPEIEIGDNVHTVGCKVIRSSVQVLKKIIKAVERGVNLPRNKQWVIPYPRYYRKRDFNEQVLAQYYSNLQNGLVKKFIEKRQENDPILVNLNPI